MQWFDNLSNESKDYIIRMLSDSVCYNPEARLQIIRCNAILQPLFELYGTYSESPYIQIRWLLNNGLKDKIINPSECAFVSMYLGNLL